MPGNGISDLANKRYDSVSRERLDAAEAKAQRLAVLCGALLLVAGVYLVMGADRVPAAAAAPPAPTGPVASLPYGPYNPPPPAAAP